MRGGGRERLREGGNVGKREIGGIKSQGRKRAEREREEREIGKLKTEREGVRRDDAYPTLLNE